MFKRAYTALSPDGIFVISLKKAPYHSEIKNDQYGSRLFYYYERNDILAAASHFLVVYYDEQTVGKTDWFTLILRRSALLGDLR